jgi:hypothetical protein
MKIEEFLGVITDPCHYNDEIDALKEEQDLYMQENGYHCLEITEKQILLDKKQRFLHLQHARMIDAKLKWHLLKLNKLENAHARFTSIR